MLHVRVWQVLPTGFTDALLTVLFLRSVARHEHASWTGQVYMSAGLRTTQSRPLLWTPHCDDVWRSLRRCVLWAVSAFPTHARLAAIPVAARVDPHSFV